MPGTVYTVAVVAEPLVAKRSRGYVLHMTQALTMDIHESICTNAFALSLPLGAASGATTTTTEMIALITSE